MTTLTPAPLPIAPDLPPDVRCCARCGALGDDTVGVVVSAPGVAVDGDDLCAACLADEDARVEEGPVGW